MEKLSSPRSEKKQGKEKVNESGLGSKGVKAQLEIFFRFFLFLT